MNRGREIPKEARWTIATHVLTRLVTAPGHVPDAGDDLASFRDSMFREMAMEIRAIADQYGMPRRNVSDLVQILGKIPVILSGPKFETRYIGGFPDEAVIRLTGCAMFQEEHAPGITPLEAGSVCQSYVEHTIKELNPRYSSHHISTTRGAILRQRFYQVPAIGYVHEYHRIPPYRTQTS